ncbi:MAG: prephenate dehydrogenase/arogenate dehydrogenase family protein [Deltaproteobacteria bacterium]|nr:prephenate dehydrogenase/arogenate dehydrogenase family protein [Deltaproteobacteria bacterium]
MNEFEIGIIGGTGGIGKWFASFFRKEGYSVHVTGRSEGMSFPELAKRCRAVIVSVPIAATPDTIRRVGPHLPPDSLLMDFTSLKEEPVGEMLKATSAEVVGCHPLFGPDCPSLAGQNVVLCPARGERWLGRMERLFTKSGARITVTTPEEHDRMMALIQGLTHLDTILMGLTLSESGIDQSTLDAFSTPVFRTKRAILKKVFGPRPELYAGLLTGNPNMQGILDMYEKNLRSLKKLILNRNAEHLTAIMTNADPAV